MKKDYAMKAKIHAELALAYASVIRAESSLAKFIEVLEQVEVRK